MYTTSSKLLIQRNETEQQICLTIEKKRYFELYRKRVLKYTEQWIGRTTQNSTYFEIYKK
jgi:hypothetical protein